MGFALVRMQDNEECHRNKKPQMYLTTVFRKHTCYSCSYNRGHKCWNKIMYTFLPIQPVLCWKRLKQKTFTWCMSLTIFQNWKGQCSGVLTYKHKGRFTSFSTKLWWFHGCRFSTRTSVHFLWRAVDIIRTWHCSLYLQKIVVFSSSTHTPTQQAADSKRPYLYL